MSLRLTAVTLSAALAVAACAPTQESPAESSAATAEASAASAESSSTSAATKPATGTKMKKKCKTYPRPDRIRPDVICKMVPE